MLRLLLPLPLEQRSWTQRGRVVRRGAGGQGDRAYLQDKRTTAERLNVLIVFQHEGFHDTSLGHKELNPLNKALVESPPSGASAPAWAD